MYAVELQYHLANLTQEGKFNGTGFKSPSTKLPFFHCAHSDTLPSQHCNNYRRWGCSFTLALLHLLNKSSSCVVGTGLDIMVQKKV